MEQTISPMFEPLQVGVSKNRGTPKWMVYNGKPYENGWFGGTIILGNTQVYSQEWIHIKLDPTDPTLQGSKAGNIRGSLWGTI